MAFNYDVGCCPGCIAKDICTDRPKIIKALQSLTNDLNTDDNLDTPGDGTIIVNCRYVKNG